MTRQRKNLLLVVLSIVLAFACFISVMPIGNKTVSADTSYNMIAGAQARKADDVTAGLRFVSYMNESAYDADNDALSYGMLIAPLDYIQDAEKGELTNESVFGANGATPTYCVDPACEKNCGKHIINLTSDALVDVTAEVKKAQGESYVEGTQFRGFKGVITEIKEANYLRKFVGVAYIKDATDPENVVYTFATTDQEENARSVAYVAQKSLDAGVEDTANGCLAKYVAKSYEAIEFDANVTGVALNETIVAEGTFEKDEQSVDAGEVTVAIKSGLEAYQYVGNKVLSGKAIGKEITVTLSAKSSDGAYTYTKDVTSVVDANGYEVLDNLVLGLNKTDSTVAVDGTSAYSMTVNGVEVATAPTLREGVLTIANSNFSSESLMNAVILESDQTKYVLDAEVYDYAIGTKAEFTTWYNSDIAVFNSSSVVLTADINLDGATFDKGYGWNAPGFASTFDGKGFVVSNGVFVDGMFEYVASTGVIKNLVVNECTTINGEYGMLGIYFRGTMENVYYNATRPKKTLGTNVSAFYYTLTGAKLKNVVVIGNELSSGDVYKSSAWTGWITANSLYIVNNLATKNACDKNIGNTFTSTDAFATYCNGKLPAGLSADFYTLDKETGLPIPIKLFEKNHTTVLPDYAVGLNKQDGLKVDLGVANAGATAKVTLDGIALKDITVDGEGFITVARDNFTVEGTKVMKVKVYANDLLKGMYSLNVDVVDIAIATVDEFISWYENNFYTGTESVALTSDIILPTTKSFNNSSWFSWTTNSVGFAGTFNGCGHVIANFKSSIGFLASVKSTGVIKNLALVNMSTTTQGSNGVLGWECRGTITDCYFQGTHLSGTSGVMFMRAGGNPFTNVVLDVTNSSSGYAIEQKDNGATTWHKKINNCYIIADNCNGEFYGNSAGWTMTNSAIYASLEAMMAEVTAVPASYSATGADWTYDATYGLIMKSALAYKQAQA